MISIDTDSRGMSCEHLLNVLRTWPDKRRFPRALYTIPTGSNPTGASMDLERKQRIYSVKCC